MAKGRDWIQPVYYIVGIIAAIVVIVIGIPKIYSLLFEPDLEATANGGDWKAPLDLEKELKGIVQVNNKCNDLKRKLVDPIFCTLFPDVCDLACEISGDIKKLSPYEAYNVGCLRAMYVIDIENNKKRLSNTLILVTDGVKYVEYEKKNAEGKQQKLQELRDQECRLVTMGELEYKARITAKVWGIEPVSRYGCFHIRHEGHDDVPLNIKTPFGRGLVRD
jgi:hypothetical protein